MTTILSEAVLLKLPNTEPIERAEGVQTWGKFKQFLATLCLGPITMGSLMNWTSPVLPQFMDQKSTTPFHFTSNEGSWVGSMLAIGALSSALISGFIADRFGSKKCLVVFTVVPPLLFTFLVVFSENVYMLCAARILSGITIGGVSVVAPMYMSEIADDSLRGSLATFFDFLCGTGATLAAVLGAYVDYVILTSTIGAVSLTCGTVLLFFPESPTYLVKVNQRTRAESALRFYRDKTFNVDAVLDEIALNIVSRNHRKQPSVREALRTKAARRGFVAAGGLAIFQQLSGMDAIVFYTVQIFEAAKTPLDSYTCGIISTIVPMTYTMLLIFVIEKANRRVFLYVSSFGTCVCLALLGLYFNLLKEGIYFTGISVLPLISLFAYGIMFVTGLGPVAWIINGEVFAPEIKGIANGAIITINWILLFVISKTLSMMLENWGEHYTFYLYSCFMALCVVFITFWVPETRGKTLQEIQNELNL